MMNTSQENLVATDDDDDDLGKSSSSQISNTDHTDLTSIPTDNSISDDDNESISESKKSVRFSIVNIKIIGVGSRVGSGPATSPRRRAARHALGLVHWGPSLTGLHTTIIT